MVGIVLASHGDFANGIFQSAEMIFGKQSDVGCVTLSPNEGPDDIKAKMEKAIEAFSDQNEVLFLIDLWGGTPFNQANGLVEKHPTWALVTGMNLPMVVEAYSARMSLKTAHEIASAIVEPAKDGVKTKPESLMPVQAKVKSAVPMVHNTIPAGTVLGDGHIKFVLARIDSRLLHGQVATSWTKSLNPSRIVVASDSVANDQLRKTMIKEAAPADVPANTIPIEKLIEISKDPRFGNTRALILFENPEDALRAIQAGVKIETLNIGSMAYSDGKVNVNNVLAMGQEDVDAYQSLKKLGIKFDVRKVPADNGQNFDALLKKAQNLLDEKK